MHDVLDVALVDETRFIGQALSATWPIGACWCGGIDRCAGLPRGRWATASRPVPPPPPPAVLDGACRSCLVSRSWARCGSAARTAGRLPGRVLGRAGNEATTAALSSSPTRRADGDLARRLRAIFELQRELDPAAGTTRRRSSVTASPPSIPPASRPWRLLGLGLTSRSTTAVPLVARKGEPQTYRALRAAPMPASLPAAPRGHRPMTDRWRSGPAEAPGLRAGFADIQNMAQVGDPWRETGRGRPALTFRASA